MQAGCTGVVSGTHVGIESTARGARKLAIDNSPANERPSRGAASTSTRP
jgi:hypothetical protein